MSRSKGNTDTMGAMMALEKVKDRSVTVGDAVSTIRSFIDNGASEDTVKALWIHLLRETQAMESSMNVWRQAVIKAANDAGLESEDLIEAVKVPLKRPDEESFQ